MDTSEQVYTGFWTNWEKGRVAGVTLTLRNGAYLVAFLAMFVRIVGSHFWRLLSYVIFHSIPVTPDDLDRSGKQQKAILRNNFSSMTAAMRFIRIARRSKTEQPRTHRPLTLASIALLNAIAFLFAGIFSSAVTQRSSSVLLRPGVCGRWADLSSITAQHWNTNVVIQGVDFASMNRQNLITSSRLYRTCNETSSLLENCFTLGDWPLRPSPVHVPCPFGEDLCAVDNAVSIDSGFLNSRTQLGINAPKEDTINFRKVATCAPLRTRGFAANVASEDGQANSQTSSQNSTGYFYGKNLRTGTNSTYVYIDSGNSSTSLGTTVDKWSYEMDVEAAAFSNSTDPLALDNSSTFDPISSLWKPYNTLALVFLVKRSKYLSPVLDPWFQAEVPETLNLPITATLSREIPVYTAKNDPVAVLGCFEQLHICNPNHSTQPCVVVPQQTHRLMDFVNVLDFNNKQKGTAQRIFGSLMRTPIAQTIYSLGPQGLLASSTIQNILPSPALMRNQWELEVRNWFGTSLAALQLLTVQDVAGYGHSDLNQYIIPYSDRDEWMCENQIVHRSDFASFSVLGLCIIFVIGCFIILLSEALYHIHPLVRYKSAGNLNRHPEWRTFDILELACAVCTAPFPDQVNKDEADSVSQNSKTQTCYVDISDNKR